MVKKILTLVLLFSFTLPLLSSAQASDPGPLFGEWGTQKQCAGELITPKGTKFAQPFRISKDWLQNGDVWCRITWTSVSTEGDAAIASVNALCGEDTDRHYQLRFELQDEALSIFWNLFHKNGPLNRCE